MTASAPGLYVPSSGGPRSNLSDAMGWNRGSGWRSDSGARVSTEVGWTVTAAAIISAAAPCIGPWSRTAKRHNSRVGIPARLWGVAKGPVKTKPLHGSHIRSSDHNRCLASISNASASATRFRDVKLPTSASPSSTRWICRALTPDLSASCACVIPAMRRYHSSLVIARLWQSRPQSTSEQRVQSPSLRWQSAYFLRILPPLNLCPQAGTGGADRGGQHSTHPQSYRR